MERSRSKSKLPRMKRTTSTNNLKSKYTLNLDLARDFFGVTPRDGFAASVRLKKHGGHSVQTWLALQKNSEIALYSNGNSLDILDCRGPISAADEVGNFELILFDVKKDGRAGKAKYSIIFDDKEERDACMRQIQTAKEEAPFIQSLVKDDIHIDPIPSFVYCVDQVSCKRALQWKDSLSFSIPKEVAFKPCEGAVDITLSSVMKDKLTIMLISYNLVGTFTQTIGTFLSKNMEQFLSLGVQVMVVVPKSTDFSPVIVEQFQKDTKLNAPLFHFDPELLGIKLRREQPQSPKSPRSRPTSPTPIDRISPSPPVEKSPREKRSSIFKLGTSTKGSDSARGESHPPLVSPSSDEIPRKNSVNRDETMIKKSDSKGAVRDEPIKKSESKGSVQDSSVPKKSDSRGSLHEFANLRSSQEGIEKKKDKGAKDELKKQDSKSSIFAPKKRKQSLSVGSLDKERIATQITKKKEERERASEQKLEETKSSLTRTNSEPALQTNILNAKKKELADEAISPPSSPPVPHVTDTKKGVPSSHSGFLNFRRKTKTGFSSPPASPASCDPSQYDKVIEETEEAMIMLYHSDTGSLKVPLLHIDQVKDLVLHFCVFSKRPWVYEFPGEPWPKIERTFMSVKHPQYQYELCTVNHKIKTRIPYPLQLIDNEPLYAGYFKKQPHYHIIGSAPSIGPVVLSVEKEEFTDKRVLLWTLQGQQKFSVPFAEAHSPLKLIPYTFQRAFVGQAFDESFSFSVIVDGAIDEDLVALEEAIIFKNFKIGVLSFRDENATEEDIYRNDGMSKDFHEFLEALGRKVPLLDHNGFSGGLDIEKNTSGEYSYYTEFHSNNVMFHVAALMPPNDSDNPRRKRFIGNDIVVIIFREGHAPLDPSLFSSNFNQLFIVVSSISSEFYEVECVSKLHVNKFLPLALHQTLTKKDVADFILSKCINGERSIIQNTKPFSAQMSATRKSLLGHLIAKHELTERIEI